VREFDLERVTGESIVERLAMMQAMRQDEEVRESEWDEESAEKKPEVAEKVIELLTVSKGKQKAAPTRAKVYSEVDGLECDLLTSLSIYTNTYMPTV
jgi:hypothetical protein